MSFLLIYSDRGCLSSTILQRKSLVCCVWTSPVEHHRPLGVTPATVKEEILLYHIISKFEVLKQGDCSTVYFTVLAVK